MDKKMMLVVLEDQAEQLHQIAQMYESKAQQHNEMASSITQNIETMVLQTKDYIQAIKQASHKGIPRHIAKEHNKRVDRITADINRITIMLQDNA